jgi:nitroimidazol reductase NimA-like FMN-containing flavoprotein (pyridoxamine 5'-phosphate oxidase superfamily)
MDAADATELSPAECLVRLRPATWGRVALSMRTIAMVVPMPVQVVDDRLLFVTAGGSTFDRAVQEQAISIQVEGREDVDDVGLTLWSVVVSGICLPGEDPSEATAGRPILIDESVAPRRVRWNALPFSLVQGWRAPLPSYAGPLPADSALGACSHPQGSHGR